jgi:signal transduction histidine kinase
MPAIEAPVPPNEKERVEALHRYEVLDTMPEAAFDDLCGLAAYICGTPVAHVSLIDGDRQFLKSIHGMGVQGMPRNMTFCTHALTDSGVFVVSDLSKDERFSAHPFVESDPHVRFYAGAPLVTDDGYALGTLCVMDVVPRQLEPRQLAALAALSRQVIDQLDLRRNNSRLDAAERAMSLARARAERANEAKTTFLARINHDVRTPLTSVLGYAEIVQADPHADDVMESVARIISASHHILALVNTINDIGRIESGALSLSPERIDVNEIVRQAMEMVGPLADAQGIATAFSADTPPCGVYADRQRTLDILLNLLSNGIKYNRKNGTLTVTCRNEEGCVRIAVADTGLGIPSDKLPLLFRPFERLGAEDTSIQGTGLGLASARRLCEAMGGTIGVESALDIGSTFFIVLPARPTA